MGNLLDSLEKWGCDIQLTVERMAGDEEFYKECLYMFVDDENYKLLGEAIDSSNYSEAFNCAHTLKGVAANLGLNPIFNKTSTIVEALRVDDYSDLDNQYQEIGQARDEFLKLIEE